jgi:hypothetical protein
MKVNKCSGVRRDTRDPCNPSLVREAKVPRHGNFTTYLVPTGELNFNLTIYTKVLYGARGSCLSTRHIRSKYSVFLNFLNYGLAPYIQKVLANPLILSPVYSRRPPETR